MTNFTRKNYWAKPGEFSKVQKAKGPISILPSSSSTLDSINRLMRPIHVKHLPLLSDPIEFKGLEIMICSPHHPWQVASHWTPFPVLGQRFYICYTCYILALGYVTQGISGPPIYWRNTYTEEDMALKPSIVFFLQPCPENVCSPITSTRNWMTTLLSRDFSLAPHLPTGLVAVVALADCRGWHNRCLGWHCLFLPFRTKTDTTCIASL